MSLTSNEPKTKNTLFRKLIALWEKEFQDKHAEDGLNIPAVPVQPLEGQLLFVGFNPSFSVPAVRRLLSDKEIDPERYFAWSNRDEFDPSVDVLLHERSINDYPYFNKFKEISAKYGIGWGYLDLFFWRGTAQKEAKRHVLLNDNPVSLSQFGESQFILASKMIEESEPRCLVIANALASDIYKSYYNLSFNRVLGCYTQWIANREIPVFLSSMFSGGNMDKYSFERLVWHIGRVLMK